MPRTLQQLAAHDCLIVSGPSHRAICILEGPGGAEPVEVSGRFSANSARILSTTVPRSGPRSASWCFSARSV